MSDNDFTLPPRSRSRSLTLATRLARRAPHWLVAAIAHLYGHVQYWVDTDRRHGYLGNVAALPERPRLERPWRAFQHHALNVLEMLRTAETSPAAAGERAEVHGRHVIDEALSAGRGLVLATLHTGNWEMAGSRLAELGYPITTVAGVQLRSGWSDHIKRLKEAAGIRVVDPRNARALYRDLAANRVIVLHLDGDVFTSGLPVFFLGKSVRVPRGPARLSRALGAPLALAYCTRRHRKKLDVFIEPPLSPPVDPADEISVTQRLISRAENVISSVPDQWCIFRRI